MDEKNSLNRQIYFDYKLEIKNKKMKGKKKQPLKFATKTSQTFTSFFRHRRRSVTLEVILGHMSVTGSQGKNGDHSIFSYTVDS